MLYELYLSKTALKEKRPSQTFEKAGPFASTNTQTRGEESVQLYFKKSISLVTPAIGATEPLVVVTTALFKVSVLVTE